MFFNIGLVVQNVSNHTFLNPIFRNLEVFIFEISKCFTTTENPFQLVKTIKLHLAMFTQFQNFQFVFNVFRNFTLEF